MKKIMSFILVTSLSLALAAPVYASRGHSGGFHGGSHGAFHPGFHHGGFHGGCCFAPAFVGGAFVSSAYPYYAYPYFPYVAPVYPDPVYGYPSVQREVCYDTGCYYLQGDGLTVPYLWLWVPAAPTSPPPPSSP